MRVTTAAQMKSSDDNFVNNRPNGRLLNIMFSVVDEGFPMLNKKTWIFKKSSYAGYTGYIEVTNLLVFDFFGEIIHVATNFPGSWKHRKR